VAAPSEVDVGLAHSAIRWVLDALWLGDDPADNKRRSQMIAVLRQAASLTGPAWKPPATVGGGVPES